MNKILLTLFAISIFGFTTLNAQNFSTHQVKKGETVEAIAEQYYVNPADIYSLNPDSKKELKPNSILIIPISKAQKPKITTIKELQGFKSHKAKRKETLFGISKKYNIEIEDLKKHNTFLYANNLRKGDKLQIPIYKITEVEETVEAFKTYTVLPKEGKWRIAYKFGTTIAELEAANPDMGEVLKEGQQIKVPNIEKTEEKVIDDTYSYYKVLPKEGFYRLKLKLGLEKEELEALNPGLAESGLQVGMILKIPFTDAEGVMSKDIEAVNLSSMVTNFDTKHIALMLPFRLNRAEFDSTDDMKKSIEKDMYLDASLDFYSGVLLAVDSLKKLGVSLKLDVYDTKYDATRVSRILLDNDFENVDAVIGPLTAKNFNTVSDELRKFHVPVVSPISTNLELYDNVFQSRPSDAVLKAKIINHIKQDSLPKHVVIITDSKHEKTATMLKNEFSESTVVFSKKNKKGEDEYFVTKNDIDRALKPGRNIVFLETQNRGFASNVTSILASTTYKENTGHEKEEVQISLVTTKFNGAFEGDEIDNTHLSKLQFTYATTSRSYNEDDNNVFIKTYYQKFGITPNKRAVKGFDLTMDVVLRVVTSEDLFMSVKMAPLTAYIENKFSYQKKMFGGYYNNAVFLVKYDDLKIIEVN
ncbi:hypothetical protein MHTCC0001_18840 [Flavobacteriaceae bacterium MHTCC 0001]